MTDENQEEATPKAKPSKPKSSDKHSPEYWMQRLQRYKLGPKRGKLPRMAVPHWQHNAAAALHGWGQHAHDEQAPIQLTESDYTKALKATESNPLKPHKGAISKHCKLKFTE